MKNKSDTRNHVIDFVNLVENQFETKVKVIRSDNGHEFKMHDFFNSKGIIHQTSCLETPEQNGVVERKHQHLLNVTRTLIFQSKIFTCFWSYALTHVAFFINITPTRLLKNCTPHEKLYGNAYDYKNLKVFGCLCSMQTLSANRSKFEPHAKSYVFLGFPMHTKAYIVFDLKNHDIKISRNVLFHEDIFPSCYNIDNNHDFSNDVCLPVNQSSDSIFANDDYSSKPTIENIDKERNDDINSNESDNPAPNSDVHRKSGRN